MDFNGFQLTMDSTPEKQHSFLMGAHGFYNWNTSD